MFLKFLAWIMTFFLLHLMITDCRIGANRIEGVGQQDAKMGHVNDHMVHSAVVFFTPKDLKLGKVISVSFQDIDPSKSPHFLPREEAERIPFSLSKLPILVDYFGFHLGSPQAKAMEETLKDCESKAIEGETKICATSLESMLDYVHDIFGPNTKFEGLSTKETTKLSPNSMQNYTILKEPKEVCAPKVVACHTKPYPYAIFYCHNQVQKSKVFQVSLGGDNGSKVEAIAICHMDTSLWGDNHVAFRVLGIEPGSSAVCHFFQGDNIVWVPFVDMKKREISDFKLSSM